MLKKIRTINSHVGHARYLARTNEYPVGVIPRQLDIPSPYHYSPEWSVWQHESDGYVVIVETSHKRYEVFSVPRDFISNLDLRSTEERRKDEERECANEARRELNWRYDHD